VKKVIVAISVFLILFALNAHSAKASELQWVNVAQWVDSNVTAFSVDPSNSNTLYFTTDAGSLYKSVDGGTSWAVIDKFLYGINSVFIDPTNPSTIYLGLGNKVYKSFDSGLTWKDISNGLPKGNYPFSSYNYVVFLSPNKTLYALNKASIYTPLSFFDIYKSIDEGVSWKKINISSVNSFVADPRNSNILYASSNSGIYKSTDGGSTWNLVSNISASSLAVDPVNTNVLYAAANNGIFKSTNSGISWTQISYIKSEGNTKILIDPENTSVIYFESFYYGLYKSTDGGSTWTNINSSSFGTIVFDPNNTNMLYCPYGASYFKSVDGGNSWTGIGSVYLTYNSYRWYINAIAVNPKNPDIVFAGGWISNNDAEAFYKSIDGGKSWITIPGIRGSITFLIIDPNNPDTIYAGTSWSTTSTSLIKSIDGGNSWVDIDIGNLNPAVYAIAIDPMSSKNMYVAADKGIFKSTDGGTSWQAINNGIKNKIARSIAIDPKNNNVIYAGADDTTSYGYTSSGTLYKSIDGGNTWIDVGSKISSSPFITYAILVDISNSNTIYAGTSIGLYKSTDSGSTWNKIADSSTNYIVIDPSDSKTVYIGTKNGAFKSVDSGTIWQQITAISYSSNYPITIDPSNSSVVYIGASDKIFKQMNVFKITKTIAGIGTIKMNPDKEWYPEGSVVAIGAVPQTGYAFINWSGDVSSVNSEIQLKMNSDKNIIASFRPSTTIKLQIGSASFTLNGETKYLDSPPIIKNGRTMLPIRAVVEALGGKVGWDAAAKKVTVTLGSNTLELWIGKNTAKVNGMSKLIDSTNSKVVPEIINGRTMLPLRFVTENLGATVLWNGDTQTITITYQGE
jgi:photosystem II stability/assembly factor-like uncharacterized protein